MNLFNNSRRNQKSAIATPAIESLESRQLLAATLAANGTWNIVGTNAADEIYVARDNVDPRILIAEVNGRVVGEEYATDVAKIQISGQAGNDHIEIDESAGAITQPTVLRGDDGHDVLIGGSGRDILIGGNGDDELFGAGADDRLYGGSGDDYLEGGPGIDLLDGGAGVNTLVQNSGGNTDGGSDGSNTGAQNQLAVVNRVPAEWERHDSTWMQWPKGEEASYRSNFAGIIRALQKYEQVKIAVETAGAQTEAARYLQQLGVPLNNIQFHIMPYDWSWMRDNGAIWVEKTDASGNRSMVVQDWGFDGWGGDGGPSRKDDAVPGYVAKIEGVPVERVNVVLEKGTLEFNGKDALITSWTVLHNRNPTMTREQLEVVLKDKFGVSKVVWIEGASQGDLTDGHVDGIARFVNENTVVVSRYTDQSDPDAALFENAAAKIRSAGFNVVRLDIPGYVRYRGEWLPANYTNYLAANGVVIASSYGNAKFDNAARLQLQKLYPDHDIVLTDTRELWYNGGAVHCVTNDQPLLRAKSGQTTAPTVNKVAPSAPTRLLQLAASIDQQFNLQSTGNLWVNWGGLNEKWLRGNDGWYFVTPNGGLYRWNRSGHRAEGTLIAQFDSSYHRDPSMIFDATEHLAQATNLATIDDLFATGIPF